RFRFESIQDIHESADSPEDEADDVIMPLTTFEAQVPRLRDVVKTRRKPIPVFPPFELEQSALARYRLLLVLAGEAIAPERCPLALEFGDIFPILPQRRIHCSNHDPARERKRNGCMAGGERWKAHVVETLFKAHRREIARMQALHHHNHRIVFRVIESGRQGAAEKVHCLLSLCIALSLHWVMGVIDDEAISALARNRSAGGGRHHDAAARVVEFQLLLLISGQMNLWREAL